MRALAVMSLGFVVVGCGPGENQLQSVDDAEAMPVPVLEISPEALDFGAHPLGTELSSSVFLSNSGAEVLEVESISMEGDLSFAIALLPNLPLQLAPEQVAEIEVEYLVESLDQAASLVVVSNDPERPEASVPMVGTWARPALCVDPKAVAFEAIPPGCDESTTVLLESCGTGPLLLEGVGLLDDSGFLMLDTEALPELPVSLDPGEAVAVDVLFEPEEEGTYLAPLVVESDDPAGSREVMVEGIGADGAACDGVSFYDVLMEAEYKVADVAFLLDLGKWHTSVAPALASDLQEIASNVAADIPDTTFGVATYRDYEPYGYSMYPYELEQQQTDDVLSVVASLTGLTYTGWSGGLATGYEALYQAATGAGYDEDCDGSYDSGNDARPFYASPMDAFSGLVAGSANPATPGSGDQGGMGFREGVLPIILLVTHSMIRDPVGGDAAPGGCSMDADMYEAYLAFSDLGAKFIGVWGDAGMTFPSTRGQLEAFAIITDSYFDLDGDWVEEPAVVDWDGSDAGFTKLLSSAILSLAANATFDKVTVDIVDPDGVVLGVTPDQYSPAVAGDALLFTFEVNGQVVDAPSTETSEVTVDLIADDTILLSRRTLFVLPP